MASLNNPFAAAFAPPADPSIYDVTRRQDLAKKLAENDKYVPNSGFLGALGQALAGSGSAFQSTTAANEGQQGLTAANAKLASLLSGTSNPSPGDLITAGGDPFLPPSETGLVGDLIKRKLGIGETYYGTPISAVGPDGQVHYYRFGSLGDQQEVMPGQGQQWAPSGQVVDTGTAQTTVNKITGQPISSVPINNAQASSDKAYGATVGPIAGNAPQQLQVEGQLLQTLDNQHQMVDATVDKAIGQIDQGVFNTGTVGSLISAVPGTPQYDLAQNLQTIKANVGFDTLQNMRQNSPTGGALGQISDMEEQLLQAVNGSLEQGQTKEQLKTNLSRIKTLLAQVNALKHQAFESDKTRLGSNPASPPTVGGQPPAAFSGKVLTYNPATGNLE